MRQTIFNPNSLKVIFTQVQLSRMREEAKEIQKKKEANKEIITNHKVCTRFTDTRTFEIGFLGEYAWESIFHQKPDTRPMIGGDGGKDFIFHGKSIQIKTSKGFLIFNNMEHFSTQIAVCVAYEPTDLYAVWVQGWITKEEFREKHFIENFGYGPKVCVQPVDLHSITTLEEYCDRMKVADPRNPHLSLPNM